MDGGGAATVAWIEPDHGAITADARRALAEWALARGVKLAAPAEGAAPEIALDMDAAARVEDELDRARDALAAQEADAAERALARAEALLRAHPELPNAAWLMAEVHRGWSARWRRLEPRDTARADAAWQRADALDGGRVAGIGESAAPPAPLARAHIVLEGAASRADRAPARAGDAPSGLALRVDGVEVSPGEIARAAGEHQVTLVDERATAVRWAAWVSLADGETIRVRAPGAPACSTGDLARASLDRRADAVRAADVACAAWIAVVPAPVAPGAPAALRVATCELDQCGPLVEWRVGGARAASAAGAGAGERPRSGGHLPVWLTAAIVVVGVAGATTAVLAATGAFDAAKTESRFVNGGLKVQ